MASLKDLIVLGPARFLDKLYGNLEGNASTATKLQTARTINGTSFDGSGNITTSYWGTARNFTIGNTTKSVNGSAAVSWSLSEIGALPHFIKTSATNANSLTTTGYYSMKSGADTNVPSTGHSMIFVDYTVGTPFQLYMHDATFTLYKRNYASSAWGAWSSTLGNSISGNAATATLAAAATKLATARSISLAGDVTGTTSFDGTGNVSITATVVDNSHNHKYLSGWADTRNVATTPNDYNGKLEVVGIKTKTGSGISFSSANTYATLVGIRGWSDNSGGNSHELAFDGNGDIYHRHGATTSWNAWKVIAHTDSDITGNAATATKLKTGNTINGTNFDGSTAITTSYWGTARTLTVGNTGKSVNGSGNVSWSIAEIGAVNKTGDTMSGRLTLNTSVTDHDTPTAQILVINCGQVPDGTTLTDKNAPGIGFHIGNNSWGSLILNGGNFKFVNSGFNGYMPVYASTFYGALSGNASSATKLQTPRAINGTNFDGTSAITTANWGTARTLTVGNKGQSVNGSSNVTWALHDILYNTSNIGTATSWDITTPGVYYVASSSAFTGTSNPEAANGGTTPYRYGQLIVSRANTGGMAQFYISHNDSNSAQTGLGIKFRTGWNSSYLGTWRTLMDSTNYTNWCDSRYINTAGDTMTGALNFANGTWNAMGDDAYIGDYNQAGMIGIKGKNGNTGIYFAPYSGSTAQTITINGSGTMTISGTVASTFSGNLNGNASTATKLGTSTIGSSTKPIYLNAGSPTAFSSTIGDASTPVYLSGGSITVCNTFKNRPYSYNKGEVYYYTWGGSQDLNWKKVFAASHTATAPSSNEYIGCTVKGTIYHHQGNHNQAEVREYPFVMYMSFIGGTTVANSCTLKTSTTCPTTIIRAVRVTTNSFELQVRQPTDWQTMAIQFSISGNCGNRSAFEPVNSSNTSALTNSHLQESIPTKVVDAYNGTAVTFAYSQSGMSSTSWLASWNGYELRAISPANVTAGKASALATSRYIFGRAFNGTADIAGKATVYGSYNATVNSRYSTAALEIRENGLVATAQSDIAYAPQIGFHWSGRVAGQLALGSDAKFRFIKQDGNTATLIATLEGNASTATSATTATKLATARTIRTNLASTSTASFDGSSNITPGVTGTLPLGNGGTGVTSLNALRKLFREWAPIDSSNDTTSNWGAKGLSVAGYGNGNTITDKPSTYGIVLNVNSADTEVHQLWFTQSSGRIFHRGGNASGWNGTWRLMYSHGDSIIYSSSEPSSPVTGTIWLKPA